MFLFRKPSAELARRFLSAQRELSFTYSSIGCTRNEESPAEFNVDHNRRKIGHGPEDFERAVLALRSWRQFDLGWLEIVSSDTPIQIDEVVAVRAHTFGLWSLNACRIVYVVNETEPLRRFGFAYGTLPDHVECGEERFMIEQEADGSVYYDIFAVSRPRHPLARIGSIVTRRLQREFAQDSIAAMQLVVSNRAET
jgi:uncharacterized protein (UPF0548 family)